MPMQAPSRGVQTRLFYIGIRFLQLALAGTAVALYARDLAKRDKPRRYDKSKWVTSPFPFPSGLSYAQPAYEPRFRISPLFNPS
jgi:hypothetical protein